MIGLIVFPAALLYLLLSVVVVRWAIRHARDHGRSAKRWGWGAALVMYLIPFWDWLPTVATHQYYCAKDSGFQVYKTLDQWKAENPGVMEGLVDNSPSPDGSPNWPTEAWRGKEITSINQRFGMLYKNHFTSAEESELFLHVWRWQNELVDKKTGDVLARRVDFSTGNGHIGGEPELRLWLHSDGCIGGRDNAIKFGEFLNQFRGAKK
jgi:hypothetical protein